MKTLARSFTKLSGAAMLVFALVCSSLCLGASGALDRVVEQGVLKVAMSGNQQPFNFVYGKKQSLVGFDVDLAGEIARLMNVELEVVRAPFDELMGTLKSGKADAVISGMTITAARTRDVTFVGPYMLSGKSMLGSPETMKRGNTADGFNVSDIDLVALKGSTSEDFIRQDLPKASLTTVANYDEGVQLLLDGKVDGMVADLPILALTRQQHRGAKLQLLTPPLSIEPLGIAIASSDDQFENLLRNYLAVFEKTGLLMRLHKKWFEMGQSRPYGP
jgi:polar amino acid transport system substrate-binding protein